MRATSKSTVFRLFALAGIPLAVAAVLFGAALVPGSMADERGDDGAFLGVGLTEEVDYPEGGARITHVVDDSPAARAGIEAGDIVVRFEGRPIRGPVGLGQRVGEHRPGDRVEIVVLRDGAEKTLDVQLGERPERFSFSFGEGLDLDLGDLDLGELQEQLKDLRVELDDLNLEELQDHLRQMKLDLHGTETPGHHFRMRFCDSGDCESFQWRGRGPLLGVSLIEPTQELRRHLGGAGDRGVLVSKVYADSAAERAGIEVGDLIVAVDGRDVGGAWEIRRALMDSAGRTIAIDVIREGAPLTLSATVEAADDEATPSRLRTRPSADPGHSRTGLSRARAAYAQSRELARDARRAARSERAAVRAFERARRAGSRNPMSLL